MFRPSVDSSSSIQDAAATVKSVIELIRMKEKYQALDGMYQDSQFTLFSEVVKESCSWVSNNNCIDLISSNVNFMNTDIQLKESANINIPDCNNIDLSQIENIYFRINLYDVIVDALEAAQNRVGKPRNDTHLCKWIANRITGICTNSTNHVNSYTHICSFNH